MEQKGLILIIVVSFIAACNWSPPSSDEGLIKEQRDTIASMDSFAAKGDTAVVQIDSLLIQPDSIKTDNAQNKDTGVLAPALGIDIKGKSPAEVMAFAETLIGIPYVYGSTNPSVGFDCSGFITHVFNHFGIQVPRSSIDFTNVGKTIPIQQAKRGDIILFTGTNPMERHVGHMGLIVSNSDTLRFIHSTSGKAKSVTISPMSKTYVTRFVKTIRIFPQNDR